MNLVGNAYVDRVPVSFLIVTALQEERDAVLAHFRDAEQLQIEGKPTYYLTTLPPSGTGGAHTIAITMLNQMGNTEAAQHVTQAISDLDPGYVLVVGIAGGVKDKVKLGDVVIATQVYYYEQEKLRPEGIDQRPYSFAVDPMLLDRSQNLRDTAWHNLVLEDRPQETMNVEQPHAVFGPIAVGEKVVADPDAVARLRSNYAILGIEMESYGAAIAAANALNRPRFLAIRGISDYADAGKNDHWRAYAAATAAAFAVGLIQSVPIASETERRKKANQTGTLVAVRHHSMEFFPSRAIIGLLPPELKEFAIKEVEVDQSDLYVGGRLIDPLAAARCQAGLERRVSELLLSAPDTRLAYYGIAHIPLLFLAGYQLSNKQPIHLFEFNRKEGCWNQLCGDRPWPQLETEGIPVSYSRTRGDVLLRISISYEISLEDVIPLGFSPMASIHLRIANPSLDSVVSDSQVTEYSVVFRRVLDEIHSKLPNVQGVHVFYAGPVTPAFCFGRQISKTIHPRIVVYNYFAQDTPPYSWGLEITSDIESEGFLVRPQRIEE